MTRTKTLLPAAMLLCCFGFMIVMNQFHPLLTNIMTTDIPSIHSEWESIDDQVSSIPVMDGSTELEQLTRFWQLLSKSSNITENSLEHLASLVNMSDAYDLADRASFANVPLKYYIAEGEFVEHIPKINTQQPKVVFIKFNISERLPGSLLMSNGGTTFLIRTRGTSPSAYNNSDVYTEGDCPYQDHFNGSYTVWCTVHDSVTEVVVYVIFTNFAAFNEKEGIKREIMRETFNYTNVLPAHPGRNDSCLEERVWDYPVMYWLYHKDTAVWVRNGCTQKFMSTTEIEVCYKKRFNDNLFVLGDSHLAYSFFYMVSLVDKPAALAVANKVEGDLKIGKYQYYWTTFLHEFTKNIGKVKQDILQRTLNDPGNNKHLLIIDAGKYLQSGRATNIIYNLLKCTSFKINSIYFEIHAID